MADSLPKGEGQDATEFLPESVINATERLGLHEPRLVTQTVNSLAVAADSAVEFSTSVPAVVFKQPAGLTCSGHMRPLSQDRTTLQVQIQVSGASINCQLGGSLATPLGHYMVLGTANSVVGDPAAMAQAAPMGMGMTPGMFGGYGGGGFGRGGYGGEYGRGGEGGYLGRPGRGAYGGEARAEEETQAREMERVGQAGPDGSPPGPAATVDPATGLPAAAEAAAPAEPKYNTSRFAFVVQVIEGESFPAEK
jgi:hypothetical protein